MKILAIETATSSVGCALWADGAPLAAFVLVASQRHAEVLMPAIDNLCRYAAVPVSDLDGVAVDVGPGLFTGLRVGLATARAIATARNLPAAGVTSLEALAHPHRRRRGLIAAVVDAKRGEVYSAIYAGDGGPLKELRAAGVSSPESLAAELVALGERPLAVGDGAWRYRDLLASGAEVAGPADMSPSPLVVAELGSARLSASSFPGPLYIRQADVRIGWEEVGGRVRGPATSGSGNPGSGTPSAGAAGSPPARPKLGA
jgi:tRNA threonylcarbamoyladenosine biosynthesis protein TsaB